MITYEHAVKKAQGALAEHRLDALVACSPANVRYFAGTSFLTMRTIPNRLALVVMTADQDPVFVYCSIEDGHAREESWLHDLVSYTEFQDRPVDVVADVLTRCGVAAGRVGVEVGYLTARDHTGLMAALPRGQVLGADAVFDKLRAVKTDDELATLQRIASATDAAIRAAFEQASEGMTEREVADRMVAEARSRGADQVLFQTMATGANGFKSHAAATETPLRLGDVVRTDFGMTWGGGYLSDIAHTAFVGRPTSRQVEVYLRLEEVHQSVAHQMREGVRACDVFAFCVRAMESAGLEFWAPHIGHSIGLGLHENPMLQPYDETVLRQGMAFMLEPLVTGHDGFYHVEDLVFVGPEGGTIVSRTADWGAPMIIGG